jgi:hypothetical protein
MDVAADQSTAIADTSPFSQNDAPLLMLKFVKIPWMQALDPFMDCWLFCRVNKKKEPRCLVLLQSKITPPL